MKKKSSNEVLSSTTLLSLSYELEQERIFGEHSSNTLLSPNTEYLLMQASDIVNWKDENLVFRGCSKKVAQLLGLKSSNDIVGKSDHDFPWGVNGYAEIFKQEDESVLKGNMQLILGKYNFFDGSKILLVKKIPIVKRSNKIVGVLCYLTEFKHPSLAIIYAHLNSLGIYPTFNLLSQIKTQVLKNHCNLLSAREEQCLCYLMQGFSFKEIAKMLQISHRTIENYINNVKEKLQCSKKANLIMRAIELGYNSTIIDIISSTSENILLLADAQAEPE